MNWTDGICVRQRQTLNIMGVIHVSLQKSELVGDGANLDIQRYLTLKDMSAEERKKVNPKVVFFAGKAAPGCKRLLHPEFLVQYF